LRFGLRFPCALESARLLEIRNPRARYRADAAHGLDGKPHPGRTPKLTAAQEDTVLSWFSRSATDFGFPNELWTAGRVAQLIHQHFGVHFHPHCVSAWLARRRIMPQKPERQARERDPARSNAGWPTSGPR
jgi:transposase